MWTRSRLEQRSFPTRLSWNLAWHARSVHWMYLKAHNKHNHMTNNIMIFNQLLIMQHFMSTCCDQARSSLRTAYQLWPSLDHNHTTIVVLLKNTSWSLRRTQPWPSFGPKYLDGLSAIHWHGKCGCTGKKLELSGTMTQSTVYSSWVKFRINFKKMTGVIACHEMQNNTCITYW